MASPWPGRPGDRSAPLSGSLEQSILDFVKHVYTAIGWPGVVLLMAVESACIPIPSEIIMPLAGWFLVQDKGRGFEWVLLAGALGALGNTIGSVVAYYAGMYGGRPLLARYGRFLLISDHDLDRADAFFARRGPVAVCVSRVLPVIRTFISFPAGIARMRFGVFVVLTFLGSFVWSVGLAWSGYLLGVHWDRIRSVMRPFDYPIAALILVAIAWFVWQHVRRARGSIDAGSPEGSPNGAPLGRAGGRERPEPGGEPADLSHPATLSGTVPLRDDQPAPAPHARNGDGRRLP